MKNMSLVLMRIALLLLVLSFFNPSICFAAAATMYVTVAGAGNNDGLTWANAMPMADYITEIEGAAEAGDKYYVEQGTYTMGEAIDMSTQDGTATLPIWIIGVVTGTSNEPPVVGDHATGDNRPLFAMEANGFTMAEYWKMYNIRFTGSENNGVTFDDYDSVFNCKSSHSGTYNFNMLGNNCLIVGSEATGAGTGIIVAGNCIIMACYIHDLTTGISMTNTGNGIYHSIIDTCSGNGVNVSNRSHTKIISNTIYNCGKGIYGTTALNCLIVNNILDGNTVGIEWTTQTWANFIDFNCWDNTDDIQDTDVEMGFYAVTGDPGMTDPGAGDFTLGSGSNCLDAGLQLGTNQGATGDYKVNIGADQDDVTAGGGGATGYMVIY